MRPPVQPVRHVQDDAVVQQGGVVNHVEAAWGPGVQGVHLHNAGGAESVTGDSYAIPSHE